jgi:hypothetical protein
MSDSKQAQDADETQPPKGSRLAVFALKQSPRGTVWVRAGSAWTNRDGSINVYLDVLPLDGKLHLRRGDAEG